MKHFDFTEAECRLIVEALGWAIDDSYTDDEIYNKAPKMNEIRKKILETMDPAEVHEFGKNWIERAEESGKHVESDPEKNKKLVDTIFFDAWKKYQYDCNGFEIVEYLGPDEIGYTRNPDRGPGFPFVVAYACPLDDKTADIDAREVRALIAWVDPKNKTCTFEYEEDCPSLHIPLEILGFLSPVPADSSAGMWRELNRRYWTHLMLCSD